VAVKVFLI